MPEYSKEEALSFIEAMRLAVGGRVGFRWMGEKLAGLAAYIESIAEENERLRARLESVSAEEGSASSAQRADDPGCGESGDSLAQRGNAP